MAKAANQAGGSGMMEPQIFIPVFAGLAEPLQNVADAVGWGALPFLLAPDIACRMVGNRF